jgi:hypothetical protein
VFGRGYSAVQLVPDVHMCSAVQCQSYERHVATQTGTPVMLHRGSSPLSCAAAADCLRRNGCSQPDGAASISIPYRLMITVSLESSWEGGGHQ